jgi:hypothetical protein
MKSPFPGMYQLSIDYKKDPPPPELSADTAAWLEKVVEKA